MKTTSGGEKKDRNRNRWVWRRGRNCIEVVAIFHLQVENPHLGIAGPSSGLEKAKAKWKFSDAKWKIFQLQLAVLRQRHASLLTHVGIWWRALATASCLRIAEDHLLLSVTKVGQAHVCLSALLGSPLLFTSQRREVFHSAIRWLRLPEDPPLFSVTSGAAR